ncbi:PGPGW domain-containing protein [Deferrisoma sp.]
MKKPWWYAAGRSLPEAVRLVRKVAVALIGGTLLVAGLVLLVLPGPGTVVIPLGLGVLALEFGWARRTLARVRAYYDRAARRERDAGHPDPETSEHGVAP